MNYYSLTIFYFIYLILSVCYDLLLKTSTSISSVGNEQKFEFVIDKWQLTLYFTALFLSLIIGSLNLTKSNIKLSNIFVIITAIFFISIAATKIFWVPSLINQYHILSLFTGLMIIIFKATSIFKS
jgi:hypothetical protein